MLDKFKLLKTNKDGSTAVEFAFFAIPFVFILIGIIEIGMLSTAATLLQGATDEAARLIRTGQAQESGDPQAAFEALLCDKVSLMIPCNEIIYEVIKIDDGEGFGSASTNVALIQPIFDVDGNLTSSGFDPGIQNSLIIVRASHRYQLMTPFVAPVLQDKNDGKRLILSTAIIQNEPYSF